MAVKRGKSQARRNSGNRGGMPGWACLGRRVVVLWEELIGHGEVAHIPMAVALDGAACCGAAKAVASRPEVRSLRSTS